MKRLPFLLTAIAFCFSVLAQPYIPEEYPSAEFHAGRRDALRKLMPQNSVAVIFSAPVRNYSNDVDYPYHQNPDMYYFSGYREPDGMLLIFSEPQTINGVKVKEVLFVQKKNPQMEQWTGVRLGKEGAQEILKPDLVLNGDEFKDFDLDFNKFDSIFTDRLYTDVADTRNPADLFDLIRLFKEKAGIEHQIPNNSRISPVRYRRMTGTLREIKTPEELVLLRKAVEISCIGQVEVMKALRPGMSEREIQGLHEFIHKKYDAENVGYPSIVGVGNNGCILHYIDNNAPNMQNRLLLMDVGAEYRGYTADVTRTIPVKGKFNEEEKQIYNLVYEAQEAAFRLAREGVNYSELEKAARQVIVDGLMKLGIAKTPQEANRYYPHGLGHHIGLDVHDRNSSGVLKKDMVMTIEPGIYIPEGSNCDKKWWGIAVRIEDDILIKEDGYELLSSFAPRSITDIEKMMEQPSYLDNYKLPALKSDKKGF